MGIRRAPQRRSIHHPLGTVLSLAMFLACPRVEATPVAAPTSTPLPSATRAVEVSSPSCAASSFQIIPFLDCLRVELAGSKHACCTLADSSGGATATASLRVTIEVVPCVADGEDVQVSVRDLSDGRELERAVGLADVAPTARPRALALAVAELIRSLGEAARDEVPPPAIVRAEALPPAPTPTPTPTSPGVARPDRLSVHLEGETRLLPTRDTTMWGGRARFTTLWRRLHLDVDLGVDLASAHDDLGEVRFRSASLGLGVGPRFVSRAAILDLGLRAGLGWAWVSGQTSLADVRTQAGSDFVSNLGLRVSADVPAGMKVRPGIALEAGLVLHGMDGEASYRPVVGMTGYYALLALGLALSP